MFATWAVASLLLADPAPADDRSLLNRADRAFAVELQAEAGFLGTLAHGLQLGQGGTYVDVRKQLGQDTLYFYSRHRARLALGKKRRHKVALLYQPLNLTSQFVDDEDIVVESSTIPAGTPTSFRYGFSFWRASYLYDVLRGPAELGLGVGLQIRNANIEYATNDGSFLRSVRDVGPVPLLQIEGRGRVRGRFFLAGELSGFWAPIRYLNGGRSDVEGAIWDAAVRAGVELPRKIDLFVSLRYLGGGAQGTSSRPDPYSDGYSRNWLHFMALSLGFTLR